MEWKFCLELADGTQGTQLVADGFGGWMRRLHYGLQGGKNLDAAANRIRQSSGNVPG